MTATATRQRLRVERIDFRTACQFIAAWHRHHGPPRGHKFSLGCFLSDWTLVGVATVGRPVARSLGGMEVTRVATDGTANACSALYAAAWREVCRRGEDRLSTYTQASESGASLRGAGWRVVATLPPRRGWTTPTRPRQPNGTECIARLRWEAPHTTEKTGT